jgi:ribose-phosphate pyrophosphokinase
VRAVAAAVPSPYFVLEKTRRGDRDVAISALPDPQRWIERTPVLVDDIISSAHTMSETGRKLTAAGFARPVCVGVHGVFAENAYEMLQKAGVGRVVTTNCIAHPSNDIDVSSLLIEPVQRLINVGRYQVEG